VSWIHIDDLCRLYIDAIENNNLHGSYNAVAPIPVTNKELTVTLAKEMRGNYFVSAHIPEFILKIMLGDRSIEVLKSATVSCEKIKQTGFTFLYPSIETALKQLVKK
jgi:NAD dependent epimerase/dehydratase family enzyme